MASDRDIERFLAKAIKRDSGCWDWVAGKKGGGYGVFYLNGKVRGAHRASLFLFKGHDLDTPLDAMHSCDNPACVNPDHLVYGSRTENMRDASTKGRIVRAQDWHGEQNPKSKLSSRQVQEIICLAASGSTRTEISARFKVSDVRLSQILKSAGMSSALTATEAAARVRRAKTHCKRGHPLSGDNLRINTNGGRICIQCNKANALARKTKKDGGGWAVEEF